MLWYYQTDSHDSGGLIYVIYICCGFIENLVKILKKRLKYFQLKKSYLAQNCFYEEGGWNLCSKTEWVFNPGPDSESIFFQSRYRPYPDPGRRNLIPTQDTNPVSEHWVDISFHLKLKRWKNKITWFKIFHR